MASKKAQETAGNKKTSYLVRPVSQWMAED